MSKSVAKSPVVWVIGAVGAAVVLVAVTDMIVRERMDAAKLNPKSPTPPPGAITDRAKVAIAQGVVAQYCPQSAGKCNYAPDDIDASWANPKFRAALVFIQTSVNQQAASGLLQGKLPGVTFPIRMDGVLDQSTFMVLQNF